MNITINKPLRLLLLLLFFYSITSFAQRIKYVGDQVPDEWRFFDRVESKFNDDSDGWQLLDAQGNNPQPLELLSWNEDLTLPGEHSLTYLSGTMADANPIYFWVAPPEYSGNWMATSYRLQLRFRLMQSADGTDNTQPDVIISNGNISLSISLTEKPSPFPGRPYQIVLDETGGWRSGISVSSPLATKSDIRNVFSNVTSLRIRAKYKKVADLTAGIEEVTLFKWNKSQAPEVVDFTPASGLPSAIIEFSGNNFSENLNENIVYFGGAKGTVINATSKHLSVIVPNGAQYGPVTVINGNTGYSTTTHKFFNPLFNNGNDFGGQIIPATMDDRIEIDLDSIAGNEAAGLSIGDLDGDGKNDLVVTESGIKKVSVFRNNGSTGDINQGSFEPKISLEYGNGKNVLGDFDGDGKIDIAVVYNQGSISEIGVFRNISLPGTLSFEPAYYFPAPTYASSDLHAADMDADGMLDLVTGHSSSSSPPRPYLSVFLNVGGKEFIEFSNAINISAPGFSAVSQIYSSDLDLDGKRELIVVANFQNSMYIFPNASDIFKLNFEKGFVVGQTDGINGLIINDFDKDSLPDIAWKSSSPANIKIRKNTNTSGKIDSADFVNNFTINSGLNNYGGISIADINSDNKPDIIAHDDGKLSVIESFSDINDSGNTYGRGIIYQGRTSSYPIKSVIADIDGDNKPDIVLGTSNTNPPKVLIYRNESYPAPEINSIENATGQKIITTNTSDPILIKGNNFFTAGEKPQTKFGMIQTEATNIENTTAQIHISPGPSYGRVSVTAHGLTGFSPIPITTSYISNKALDTSSYKKIVEIPIATGSHGISITDVNNDGKPDVLLEQNNKGTIFINRLNNSGDPINEVLFEQNSTELQHGRAIKSADFDGDRKMDIVADGYLFRNAFDTTSGNLLFEDRVVLQGNFIKYLVDHDFNKDGKAEILSTSTNQIHIFRNLTRKGPFTAGTFPSFSSGTEISFASEGTVQSIDAADFDGDGWEDIAFGVSAAADHISVIRNKGKKGWLTTDNFETAINFEAADAPLNIRAADFDLDGKIDFAVANNNAEVLSIFANKSTIGNISFIRTDVPSLMKGNNIEAADLNGDGKPEIIITHALSTTQGAYSIFVNKSTTDNIAFNSKLDFATTNTPVGLALADLNLDHKIEILIKGNSVNSKTLSIYESNLELTPFMGVEKKIENCTTIFPNPVEEEIHLASEFDLSLFRISLLSSQGKLIKNFDRIFNANAKLSLKELPDGIYFLQLESSQGMEIYKVVKVK